MTREEFQNQFGATWAQITANPAFFAAMQLVSAGSFQRVATLTDAEIKEHGTAILADFRGRLATENALIELAVSNEIPAFDVPAETYADPAHLKPREVEPSGNGGKAFVSFQVSHPPTSAKPKSAKPKKKK